jgi:hypothetical protein
MQQFFRCDVCDVTFPTQTARDEHARLAHPGATAMELASQLAPGMKVIGSDGITTVGTIKEVRGSDFLVDRATRRNIYIPSSAIRSCANDQVTLHIPGPRVDDMDWPSPPLLGGTASPEQPRAS